MAVHGRPARVRGVHSFQSPILPVPADVVLDASFVIEALVKSAPLQVEAEAFMRRLVSAGAVVYYNRLLEVEFAEVAFKFSVIEQHGKKGWPAKRNDGRVRRWASRIVDDLRREWNEVLTTVDHLCIELEEVVEDIPNYMAGFGLASYDAAHAATAAFVGASGLVTLDAGFGRAPEAEFDLYADDSRVRSARRHRGGR